MKQVTHEIFNTYTERDTYPFCALCIGQIILCHYVLYQGEEQYNPALCLQVQLENLLNSINDHCNKHVPKSEFGRVSRSILIWFYVLE